MGKCGTTLLIAVTVAAVAFICNLLFGASPAVPSMSDDGWFGRGKPRTDIDESIMPFIINIEEGVLDDLQRRLASARLGEDLENVKFEYGFRTSYMKDVISYWQNEYDWRKHEAILNQFPQFKTNIEGIDIYFLHVKPKHPTGKVLLMTHGWPGSVWEFYKILPMLTDPVSYGREASEAFEVICPSIPGYGFSEASHQPGMNAVAVARIFTKLMSRLGHDKFYLQAGDWGAFISSVLAMAYPQKVQGLHLNMFSPPKNSMETTIKLVMGSYFPSLLGISEWEHQRAYPISKMFVDLLRNTGYTHIQATKPDTIAFGLNDSPVGLAAYILEKFGSTTNEDDHLSRDDGGITQKFTLDELLTNVMIYWTTGTIGSSVRFYRENLAGFEEVEAWDRVHVTVPTGLAAFPHEVLVVPRALAELKFKNIQQYSMMERGGHFAALEEPRLLADDFLSFIRIVEKL